MTSAPQQRPVATPSRRQAEILRLLAAGHSRPQVADVLGVSPHTVAFHVRRILIRTKSRTLIEAACKLGAFAIPSALNTQPSPINIPFPPAD